MKKKFYLNFLLVGCCIIFFGFALVYGEMLDKPDPPPVSSELVDNKKTNNSIAPEGEELGTDVLEKARELNERGASKHQKEFRPGHVSPRELANYLTETDNGFVIQLPSYTNVPTPTIDNGKLLVSGGFGSVDFFAFDAFDGDLNWAIALDDDGPSSAVVEDGIVVFNTESCTIFAVKEETGDLLWSYWLGDPLMSTPTIAGGKVFTAYPASVNMGYSKENPDLKATHGLICIDLHSGDIIWQKWIDGDIMSAPVAKDGELFVTTFPGTFFKFQQEDGKLLTARKTRATSAPVIYGDQLFLSRRSDKIEGAVEESISSVDIKAEKIQRNLANKPAPYLDKDVQANADYKSTSVEYDAGNGFAGGAPEASGWYEAEDNIGQGNVSSLQAFQGSRVLHFDDRIYSTMGDELVCTKPKTGEICWEMDLDGDLKKKGGFMGTPPIVAGNRILIATITGDIILIDPVSGSEVERFSTGEPIRSQPVVNEGWIYAATQTGKIVAINTNDAAITGWPMWGGNSAHTN